MTTTPSSKGESNTFPAHSQPCHGHGHGCFSFDINSSLPRRQASTRKAVHLEVETDCIALGGTIHSSPVVCSVTGLYLQTKKELRVTKHYLDLKLLMSTKTYLPSLSIVPHPSRSSIVGHCHKVDSGTRTMSYALIAPQALPDYYSSTTLQQSAFLLCYL
jgi:hypothetical protein